MAIAPQGYERSCAFRQGLAGLLRVEALQAHRDALEDHRIAVQGAGVRAVCLLLRLGCRRRLTAVALTELRVTPAAVQARLDGRVGAEALDSAVILPARAMEEPRLGLLDRSRYRCRSGYQKGQSGRCCNSNSRVVSHLDFLILKRRPGPAAGARQSRHFTIEAYWAGRIARAIAVRVGS